VPLWTNRFSSSGVIAASALETGGGNIYVGGSVLAAYSADGALLWTNQGAWTMAADNDGNVYIAGNSVVAYSRSGSTLWSNAFLTAAYSMANTIAVSSQGKVYVSGYLNANTHVYATIAYSMEGVPIWTNYYDGPAGWSEASALTVGANEDVYVTGSTFSGVGYHTATLAYSSTGAPLWTNLYQGAGSPAGEPPLRIATDKMGNVYVTGSSDRGSGNDFVTLAYSMAGVPLWTNFYDGVAHGDDRARCIATGPQGEVFVLGAADTGGATESVLMKYINPPRILAIKILADGKVELSLNATGISFFLEGSANLADWETLTRFPEGQFGPLTYLDGLSSMLPHFYRIGWIP